MRFTKIHSLMVAVVLTATFNMSATAGSKTLTFGWEDGTSTVLGEYISGGNAVASYSNVTEGMEVDYGPTGTPFVPPAPYDVLPNEGSRMLEVSIDPVDEDSSNAVSPFLAYVEHLDEGDLIQFSFQAYDPSEGRSPSVLIDGTYAQNGDIGSFAGFFTPFQEFPPGTGWLNVVMDNAPDGISFPVDPNVPFDVGDQGDREAVVLRARPFRPSLSTLASGGSGSYKFFIDNLRISVTSDNPQAQITLPDGSVTLVNSTTVAGDYDDSGQVDQGDLDLVLLNWEATWPPEIAGWINDQPTDDGVVDKNDLDAVVLNWGNTAALAASAVPEPNALVLLVVGLLLCGRVPK